MEVPTPIIRVAGILRLTTLAADHASSRCFLSHGMREQVGNTDAIPIAPHPSFHRVGGGAHGPATLNNLKCYLSPCVRNSCDCHSMYPHGDER